MTNTALPMARGINFFGFFVSSPRLEALSKPMKDKNANTEVLARVEKLFLFVLNGIGLRPLVEPTLNKITMDKIKIKSIEMPSIASIILVLILASIIPRITIPKEKNIESGSQAICIPK